PDWGGVLDALAEALHRIQVQQLVPGAATAGEGIDAEAFAQRLRPEVVQLWYQMALGGRRDLHLAPSPRAGFEMAVLRMLAFRPAAAVPPVPRDPGTGTEVNSGGQASGQGTGMAAASASAAPTKASAPVAQAAAVAPVVAPVSAAPEAPEAPAPRKPAPVPAAAEPVKPAKPAVAAPAADDDLPPWHRESDAADRDEALAAEMATPDAAMVAPWEAPTERTVAPAAPAPVREAPAAVARPEGIVIAPSAPDTAPSEAQGDLTADAWLELVAGSQLNGPSKQLAAHSAFISYQHGVLKLAISPGFEYLSSDRSQAALIAALTGPLGQAPRLVIDTGAAGAETLHQRADRQRGERQTAAEAAFMADPSVQLLVQQHGARVVADSIRPFEE
ncbi:MAG: DNA polymerase III subunit gamma/tau C-terminal domain-containing protein, partial [Stenotrophomonas maltophilia]